jgi:hypothetical protein
MSLFNQAAKGDFEPAPPGLHDAACIDVVDLGLKDTEFGPKHKIRITFQLDALLSNGKRAIASKQFNLSSSEKSTLRLFIEAWRGKAFGSREEFGKFNEEKLVGQPALISIVHAAKGDQTYANINGVFPAKNKTFTLEGDYIRMKDRPPEGQQRPQQTAPAQTRYAQAARPAVNPSRPQADDLTPPVKDDDVPF